MPNKEQDKIKEQNEKTKQWLWRYRDAKKEVKRLEGELQELIELQKSCGAIQYSDMPKGGGDQGDLSDYMIKQEELWKKIHKARYKRILMFSEVKNVIDRLPSVDEREVMSYRYIQSMPWERICMKVNLSRRNVYYIHGKALENIRIHDFIAQKREEQ